MNRPPPFQTCKSFAGGKSATKLPDSEPGLPDREPHLPNRKPGLPDWNLFCPILPDCLNDNCRSTKQLSFPDSRVARFFASFIGIVPYSPLKKAIRRSMGVSPMSRMGILPMFLGICTGGTPVRLMGKMPMLLFQRADSQGSSVEPGFLSGIAGLTDEGF
jgi:hypothetical protein